MLATEAEEERRDAYPASLYEKDQSFEEQPGGPQSATEERGGEKEQLHEREAEGGGELEPQHQLPIWTMGPRRLVVEQGREFEQSPGEGFFSASEEGEEYAPNLEFPQRRCLIMGKVAQRSVSWGRMVHGKGR